MKIVSTNKSDIFDQYLSIIKRYNEKRIIKNASNVREAENVFEYILRRTGGNITGGGSEFLKLMGLKNANQLKKIIEAASKYNDNSKAIDKFKKAYKEVLSVEPSEGNIGALKSYLYDYLTETALIQRSVPAAPAAAAPAVAASTAPAQGVAPAAARPAAPAAAAPAAAAPTATTTAPAIPSTVDDINNFATKGELNKAIKDSSNEVASELKVLAEQIKDLNQSAPEDVSITIKKLEDSIKQTDALKTRLESLAEKTERELKAIEDLSKAAKEQNQSKSFLQRASEFFGQNKEVHKKSFIMAAAKYMATAAAITAGIYYTYSYFSDDKESIRGTSEDQVRIPTGESVNQRGTTGNEYSLDENKTALGNILSDPSRRREYFESINQMDEERREDILNKIARYYGASGYIMLQNPVTIKGELIEYVFPRAFRGGRDPIKDPARRAVTEDYFTKVYTQDTRSNRRIITRFESSAGSSDAQRIANYAFSTISASGLFSGDGALFGDRGDRYGRGKRNVGRSDIGIAGTSRRKMTREERRAVNRGLQESEAIDYMSDEDLDFTDPMEAFASAYSEDNKKYSNNLNLSTNNSKSYEFAKKADKISNRYFKDAVKDLESDEFMKAYYSGYSKLHNQKAKKPKQDYNKLYDLHDETGEELIHKSHPKAISVAEAIGSGGLVENLNERSKSMQDIAKRTPSGNYRARYASKKD